MKFTGIGIDICTVDRVRDLLDTEMGQHWMERIFTSGERERIALRFGSDTNTKKARLAVHIAGLYAAKEAIGKATGKGFMGPGRLKWQDVELSHTADGAPEAVILNGPWAGRKIDVSISHDGGIATAMAVLWEE